MNPRDLCIRFQKSTQEVAIVDTRAHVNHLAQGSAEMAVEDNVYDATDDATDDALAIALKLLTQ